MLNAYPVKILKAIKEKFSNNALFNSAPDAETRSVFDECQVIIWAVEGKEQNEATKNRGIVYYLDVPFLLCLADIVC